MESAFQKLLVRAQELKDLGGVIGLATWDQETYLPAKGTAARSFQLATLQGIYHERLVEPALGELLSEVASRSPAPDAAAMVRVLTRERDRALKLPPSLVRALAEAQSQGVAAWRAARARRDFAVFLPKLETLLELRRQQADALGHPGERYDALLDAYEPGMRVSRLTPVLTALKEKLVSLLHQLSSSAAPAEEPFRGRVFPRDRQWRFTLRLLKDMGFDFESGRQDMSVHPFTGGTHPQDVRLTTRVDESNPFSALFGSLHEGGHGLYEQGFAESDFRTPLAACPSMGLHESQSRLWENLVGRSRPFWHHYFPLLKEEFPEAVGDFDEERFYAEVNRVRPSFIRVEADEVTYNLHIVLRYELELVLLSGELPLGALPSEWNRRMEASFGIRPPDDLSGVLQDIHWAWGELGYFPTYALGNLYSASLFEAAQRELGDLPGCIGRGELLVLTAWLRKRIHSQGFRLPAEELVTQVTGRGLTDSDFTAYLHRKYVERG